MEFMAKAADGNVMEMHAHVCSQCLKDGKQVLWLHADKCKGIESEHRCPECGGTEWKKSHIPVAQLPNNKVAAAVAGANVNIISQLFDFFLLAAVAFLAAYWGILAYQELKKLKSGAQ